MTTTDTPSEPRWISITEASRLLGVSRMTTRRMAARGDVRGYRIHPRARWRISLEHVKQLCQVAQDSTAEPTA